MTTICWDGKILAADTRYIEGDSLFGYCRKILLLNNGQVLAAAGDVGFLRTLRDCLENNKNIAEAITKKELNKFGALLLDPSGVMWYFDSTYKGFIPLDSHIAAIGSGGEIAIAFMRHRYTAVNAIKAVARTHVTTNNIIDTYDPETQELTLAPFPE